MPQKSPDDSKMKPVYFVLFCYESYSEKLLSSSGTSVESVSKVGIYSFIHSLTYSLRVPLRRQPSGAERKDPRAVGIHLHVHVTGHPGGMSKEAC